MRESGSSSAPAEIADGGIGIEVGDLTRVGLFNDPNRDALPRHQHGLRHHHRRRRCEPVAGDYAVATV